MDEKQSNIPIEDLTYEQAFSELEDIVLSLEAEEHPLEQAITLYERGQSLVNRCATLLDVAEQKVMQWSGDELAEFDRES